MDNRNTVSTPDGSQSPQDKAVQNPDQWKTGSESLTEAQQANQHTQPEQSEQSGAAGSDDKGDK